MSKELELELDALLAAWRKSRSPELADAIDRVSDALTPKEKPLAKKAEWWAAFEADRPASVSRLLEGLPAALDRADRLAAFAKRPDPRVGTFARKWLTEPPVEGKKRAPFYGALATVLEKLGDSRLAPVLAEVVGDRALAIKHCGLPNYKPLVALAESYAKLKPKPGDAKLVARVDALLRTTRPKAESNPSALFASVYAD